MERIPWKSYRLAFWLSIDFMWFGIRSLSQLLYQWDLYALVSYIFGNVYYRMKRKAYPLYDKWSGPLITMWNVRVGGGDGIKWNEVW